MMNVPPSDTPESYSLIVRFSVHADKVDAFLRAADKVFAHVVQEKECVS